MTGADMVGLLGVGLLLLAYGLVTFQVLSSEKAALHWINLAGACAILYSLTEAWNLPMFLLEIVWALISVYGIVRATIRARRARLG